MDYSIKLPARIRPIYNSMDQFSIIRKVGEGAYSVVYECIEKTSNRIFAVKKTDLSKLSALDRENCENEIKIHKDLNHANIVRLVDFFTDQTNLFLVMEMCSRGILLKLMGRRQLDNYEIMKIFRQVCLGIYYMHFNKILMRDIKPENILLDDRNNIKLCDFGWSTHSEDEAQCQLKAGTFAYMSPECLRSEKQSFPTDVWALGILLYELFTNQEPFGAKSEAGMLNLMIRNKLSLSDIKVDSAGRLISRMLRYDPLERPTIVQVLSNHFFLPLFQSGYNDSGPRPSLEQSPSPDYQSRNGDAQNGKNKKNNANPHYLAFENSDRFQQYGYQNASIGVSAEGSVSEQTNGLPKEGFFKRIGVGSRQQITTSESNKVEVFGQKSNALNNIIDSTKDDHLNRQNSDFKRIEEQQNFSNTQTNKMTRTNTHTNLLKSNNLTEFSNENPKKNLGTHFDLFQQKTSLMLSKEQEESKQKATSFPTKLIGFRNDFSSEDYKTKIETFVQKPNANALGKQNFDVQVKTIQNSSIQDGETKTIYNIYTKSKDNSAQLAKFHSNIYSANSNSNGGIRKMEIAEPRKNAYSFITNLPTQSADFQENTKKNTSMSPNPVRKLFKLDSSTNKYVGSVCNE